MHISDAHQRLQSLWGVIDRQHNALIASRLSGHRVLDIGCGYGSLVAYLRGRGFAAEGIDSDVDAVRIAQRLFPDAPIRVANSETLDQYPPQSFDAIVLKDALHHVVCEGDFAATARTIQRLLIPHGLLVILDPNPMWILKIARRLSSHQDVEVAPARAWQLLRDHAFTPLTMDFAEIVGLPLSGGYVGIRWVPNVPLLNRLVAASNHGLARMVNALGLGPQLCWRYVISARAASGEAS